MKPSRFLVSLLISLLTALPAFAYDPLKHEEPRNDAEYKAKIKEAEALYKEKCEKVAGIKIYKTVPEVEGVLLMKIRPERTDSQLSDPLWPGAAFGGETRGDGYITSFLGNETRNVDKNGIMSSTRGYIGTKYPPNPGALPGYRWVEVLDPSDGQRYRYKLEYKEVTRNSNVMYGYDGKPFTVKENVLDKTPSPAKAPPRYAVTYEDHVIPEERALWVASSTVKVLDLNTNEVLGEMTRYAISYIHTPRQSMPWLNHGYCPDIPGTSSQDTRKFVDQILIPKREN